MDILMIFFNLTEHQIFMSCLMLLYVSSLIFSWQVVCLIAANGLLTKSCLDLNS